MELSPMDVTAPLRLGRFMIYLDIVLKISLILLIVVSIVAIIYGLILLRNYINLQKDKTSINRKS